MMNRSDKTKNLKDIAGNRMIITFLLVFPFLYLTQCKNRDSLPGEIYPDSVAKAVEIYPDSVINDVSSHPIGINLDYFMDDDNYLKPARRTADALKAMGVKYLRYPGGNKSDFYFFSKPPYFKSEPTLARTGKDATGGRGRMLKNDKDFKYDVLDFNEFIAMCREINAEPVVVVAADEYLVDYPAGNTFSTKEQLLEHAAAWVRYSNIEKNYNVKYWMIGNESWHEENKNSTAELYALDVVDFSKAMKSIDPSIHIVPNGNSDEFWKAVLKIGAGHIDDICVSNYPVYNYHAGYITYRDSLPDLMEPVRRALRAVDKYASPSDRKKLKLIVSEYGPFDWGYKWPLINNMGLNLANFEITGEQLLEPRIAFSCFWNTRWINNDSVNYSVFDALDKDGNFNANGYGMMIWGKFLGEKMVKTTSDMHIRTFASTVPSNNRLSLFILNKSDQPVRIKPEIAGYPSGRIIQAWELTGAGPEDTNPVWSQKSYPETSVLLTISGTSIQVVEFQLR